MFSARTSRDLRPNALTVALAEHRAAGRPLLDLPLSNHNMHPQHRDVLSGAARATLERTFADDLDRFGYDW